jgi:opacity protein-like surface antigen
MKKPAILSALIILLYSVAFSQKSDSPNQNEEIKTLLGHNKGTGAYGAFTIGYSVIDNKQAILFGGRFAWIASHYIGFGIGGTGFINEYHYEPSLNRDVFLTGGYGGLYIEPILMPKSPIHVSFPVLFGIGGISYVSKESNLNNNLIEDYQAFLLFEPAAEFELNLTKHFRFALGASYRFPTPFDVGLSGTPTASTESIRGFSYMATFKFGRF